MLLSKIRLRAKHLSDLGNYHATIKTPRAGAVVRTLTICPQIVKTGSLDTQLAFFIRIWEGSRALKASCKFFRVSDEPQMSFEIRWRSG